MSEWRGGRSYKSGPATGWSQLAVGVLILLMGATGYRATKKKPNQTPEPTRFAGGSS